MALFDQLIKKAVECIESWDCKGEMKEVTIIRDVTGCITFLLDARNEIEDENIIKLKQISKGKLKKYFRGNVYCKQNRNSDLVTMMIAEIESLRWTYDDSKAVKYFLLERAIAKKAWVEYRCSEKAIWNYSEAVNGSKPKVVTFYSFKGGMGRTTALAAAALILAKKGKNVLAIDTDIEAPGLASLFFEDEEDKRGVIDYLLEAIVTPLDEKINMRDMIQQVTDPQLMDGISGKIFIMQSGRVDNNYLQKLARIDYQDAVPDNMKNQLTRMIMDALAVIRSIGSVDYVLLDARAGFHDMGGVITVQMPHGVMLFGKDSTQSWQGMGLAIQSIGASQIERPFIGIVDSVCGMAGNIPQEERESFKKQAYTVCCDSYYMDDEEQPGIEATDVAHSPIFVPYQPLLSTNVQLYMDGSEGIKEKINEFKQLMLGEPYQKIVQRIEQWFEMEGESDE